MAQSQAHTRSFAHLQLPRRVAAAAGSEEPHLDACERRDRGQLHRRWGRKRARRDVIRPFYHARRRQHLHVVGTPGATSQPKSDQRLLRPAATQHTVRMMKPGGRSAQQESTDAAPIHSVPRATAARVRQPASASAAGLVRAERLRAREGGVGRALAQGRAY